MGGMELIVILVGGLLGWQHGTFGRRELQFMGLVAAGWTAVTTAASVPFVSLTGLAFVLVARTLLVGAPFALAVLARRLQRRG